jgi:hypothetical protein
MVIEAAWKAGHKRAFFHIDPSNFMYTIDFGVMKQFRCDNDQLWRGVKRVD